MLADSNQTVLDGGLGILPDSIDNIHLLAGVCEKGTTNAVLAFSDVSVVRNTLGAGPLAEAIASALTTPTKNRAPRPVYAVRIATTDTGSCGAVTKTAIGTSTGTITVAGGAYDTQQVRVKISRTGTLNSGAFQVSLDGGVTYDPEVTIPAGGTYLIPNTNVTLSFVPGGGPTYFEAGDVHAFDTVEARPSSTEVGTAIDALLLDPTEWSFVRIVGAPKPEMTTVVSAGTTPPVVSLTGTPAGFYDLRIEITAGGARGTAVFRWSTDAGNSWTSNVTTAATVALGSTGLTAVFATGSNYSTDNVYTSHAGKGLRDRADTLKTKLTSAETAFRYAFGIVEAPDASDAILQQAMASFESVRVACAAGYCRVFSALSQRRYKRCAGGPISNRIASIEPHIHPGWVDLGSLVDVVELFRDERVTEVLDAKKFLTLRTFIGRAGAFVTDAKLFAPTGSDFSSIMNRRVMDKACRITRSTMLPVVNQDMRINPAGNGVSAGLPGAPGTIDERDARVIDDKLQSALDAGLTAQNQVSSVTAQCNRTDNLLSNGGTLRTKVRVTPKGYAKSIENELAFQNPALAA